MSTRPTTLPKNGPQEHGERRRLFPRLRDTRIRSKLALLLVVPLAAVIALATIRLVAVGQGAYDASTARSLTSLAQDISALTQALHRERMAAAVFLTDPTEKADPYNEQVRSTDALIAAYRAKRHDIGAVPAVVEDRLHLIDDRLATMDSTRREVLDRKEMPVTEAVLRYGVVLTDLVGYGDALGQLPGDDEVSDSRRAVAAFARAKAATAEEEAVAFAALSSGTFGEEQFSSFVATLTSQQEALVAFSLAATPEQQAMVEGTVAGDAAVLADRAAGDVTRSRGLQHPLIDAVAAAQAVGGITDLMRWAETQLEAQLLAQADQVQTQVVRQAIIESVLVLIALIIAIVLAVVLARSLNDSLRRLREGALSVANHDLPDAVNRLRDVGSIGDGGVEEIVRQVRDPIRLPNRDEVGQVALAFNVVHREAVRIAAEQAALRTSVSAMFLNLARRSQALVDRMIGELDQIERGEEDPKRLAQLFQLDHLATRMRRNDENLLVLAGADSAVPRREDALLVDALRAAQSEVELYNRIEFGTVDTDIAVAAHAVNDVVRLVAELLDNATRFSPPNTSVVADARRIRDYVLIQVEDRGLGLSDEQFDALNRRLAAPPAVDVAAFRLMGLAVVSRLASRYGIRVELRRNLEGGTVAQVTLPSSTVVLPKPRGREQVLSRPRQLAVEPGPAAAATNSHWPEPMTPLAARTSAATLADQWRDVRPAQWSPPADPRVAGLPVNAGTQAITPQAISPYAAGPQATGPQAMTTHQPPAARAAISTPSIAESIDSLPTSAYPMVGSMPQRRPGGDVATYPSQPAAIPGVPVPGIAGSGAVVPANPVVPRPEDSGEMSPIFREMEAVWFRSHGQDATTIFPSPIAGQRPTGTAVGKASVVRSAAVPVVDSSVGTASGATGLAGQPALPTRTPGQNTPGTGQAPTPYVPPTVQPAAVAPAAAPHIPQQRAATEGNPWRTAADEGWELASRAAAPAAAGTTRSGLPKRVPQAQLVPGGVATPSGRDRTRRTPDEVRGLLSAYHRGVQRGRLAGRDQNGTTSTKETSE